MPIEEENNHYVISLKTLLALDYQKEIAGLDLEDSCKARLIQIRSDGFIFSHPQKDKGQFRYIPHLWSQFLEDYLGARQNLPADTFNTQQDIYGVYHAWCSVAHVELIRAGKTTYHEVKSVWPWLFEHPIMQQALAVDLLNLVAPKKKPGRPPKLDTKLLNLYGWASYYYQSDPTLPLDLACAEAVENHSELVPSSWNPPVTSEDIEFHLGRRLKQEMGRIERKFPQFDQKSYRNRRK